MVLPQRPLLPPQASSPPPPPPPRDTLLVDRPVLELTRARAVMRHSAARARARAGFAADFAIAAGRARRRRERRRCPSGITGSRGRGRDSRLRAGSRRRECTAAAEEDATQTAAGRRQAGHIIAEVDELVRWVVFSLLFRHGLVCVCLISQMRVAAGAITASALHTRAAGAVPRLRRLLGWCLVSVVKVVLVFLFFLVSASPTNPTLFLLPIRGYAPRTITTLANAPLRCAPLAVH